MERISDRRGAELAEDGNARKNGKAIAMAGWGHLCLPFCGREVEVRGGPTEGGSRFLPGTCGGGELGRVVPSWLEVDGSPIQSEQAAKNTADGPP
jgi:hypothetical protein